MGALLDSVGREAREGTKSRGKYQEKVCTWVECGCSGISDWGRVDKDYLFSFIYMHTHTHTHTYVYMFFKFKIKPRAGDFHFWPRWTNREQIYLPLKTTEKNWTRSSHCGTVETNPTRNHEVSGSIPGLAQWVKDPASPWANGVSCRHGLDLV